MDNARGSLTNISRLAVLEKLLFFFDAFFLTEPMTMQTVNLNSGVILYNIFRYCTHFEILYALSFVADDSLVVL